MDKETMDFFEGMFDSLKREMNERFDGVNTRLERIELDLRRHGGAIIAGTRWMARNAEWSQGIDNLLEDRDRRLDALEDRVRKLEQRDRPS